MEDEYIELNNFLKIKGLAQTGGQAKQMIRAGDITVNGEVETRVKRKLHDGDVIEYDGNDYKVVLVEGRVQ